MKKFLSIIFIIFVSVILSFAANIDELKKAAEQGDAQAQYNLGNCYAFGKGVEKNLSEAVKWYRKAAEQGDAQAQYNLGVCYYNGQGMIQNNIKAYAWIAVASANGCDDATKALQLLKEEMSPLQIERAINLAEKEGIKVYTIGVGAEANFINSLFGLRNNELDEKSLKTLAQRTKGNYFRATDLNSLAEIYNRIDALEPEQTEGTFVQDKTDLFYIPLLMALVLVFLGLSFSRSFVK